MLGVVGFIAGSIVVGSFAYSAQRAYATTVPSRKLRLFTAAFGALAAAMLIWSFAAAAHNPLSIQELVLASDCLLLFATGCMLLLLLNHTSISLLVLLAFAGSLLIGLRAFAYPPTALVRNGLLYFNLDSPLKVIFVGAFALIWLPAVMTVAGYAGREKSFPGLQNALTLAFAALIVVTGLFVATRRSSVIIGLFILIPLLFLAMTAINFIVLKLHQSQEEPHAAKGR